MGSDTARALRDIGKKKKKEGEMMEVKMTEETLEPRQQSHSTRCLSHGTATTVERVNKQCNDIQDSESQAWCVAWLGLQPGSQLTLLCSSSDQWDERLQVTRRAPAGLTTCRETSWNESSAHRWSVTAGVSTEWLSFPLCGMLSRACSDKRGQYDQRHVDKSRTRTIASPLEPKRNLLPRVTLPRQTLFFARGRMEMELRDNTDSARDRTEE
ncbi:Hypothetical protein SMAX5B_006708 [Scophthalmus maximus]|uniref:Uncharacterized protein n=1 Tax=Scophthalmus maximus TaxID=52904 RepID=A0A2U9AVN4_SCOMX|nr:Hypothetical protein SMAX5B_006708 [Scophthalmus maximus]